MFIQSRTDTRPVCLTLQVTSGSDAVSVIFFHYSFSHSRYCLVHIIIISLVLCRSLAFLFLTNVISILLTILLNCITKTIFKSVAKSTCGSYITLKPLCPTRWTVPTPALTPSSVSMRQCWLLWKRWLHQTPPRQLPELMAFTNASKRATQSLACF